jgi:hypothetical protein
VLRRAIDRSRLRGDWRSSRSIHTARMRQLFQKLRLRANLNPSCFGILFDAARHFSHTEGLTYDLVLLLSTIESKTQLQKPKLAKTAKGAAASLLVQ